MSKSDGLSAPVQPDKNRDFFRIASFSTALALGCAAATVYSVKLGSAGITIELSWGTLVAFAAAAGVGVYYWRLIEKGRRSARWLDAVMILLGLALFLYPVRFVAPEKKVDVAVGLVLAMIFLGTAGWLIWRCMRFFDPGEPDKEPPVSPKSN